MYDTVAGLLMEPPRSIVDAIAWKKVSEVQTDQGRRVSRSGGDRGSVHVILHPDGRLKAERSLPKALTGQNAEELTQADVPDALEAVDRELFELTRGSGVKLPPFGEWAPCRVDYPRSIVMPDPALVDIELARLATLRLPRKGRPVVGESGSVSWPSGEFRPKVYNKGRETGVAAHFGILRLEVGAFGSRALASIPGLLPVDLLDRDLMHSRQPASLATRQRANEPDQRWEPGRKLRVIDALVPQASEYVIDRFTRYLGGFAVSTDDLNDVQFLREMVSFFGYRRAFGLLGLCIGWGILGVRGPADLEAIGAAERTTWFRAMADLRRFRDKLDDDGQEPGTVDDVREHVYRLARRQAA